MRTCFSCSSAVATIRGRCETCHEKHFNSAPQRALRKRRAILAEGTDAAAQLRKKIRGTLVECAVCKGQFLASLVDIDHRLPLYKGGQDVPENLQLLCSSRAGNASSCHAVKTAQDMGYAPL